MTNISYIIRPNRKPIISEGDVFVLPVEGSPEVQGVGVVARLGPNRDFLGYFFLVPKDEFSTSGGQLFLQPKDACCIYQAVTRGFRKKTWTVVGKIDPWKREEWPIPQMKIDDPDSNGTRIWIVTYADNLREISRRRADSRDGAQLGSAGIAGELYMEERLGILSRSKL